MPIRLILLVIFGAILVYSVLDIYRRTRVKLSLIERIRTKGELIYSKSDGDTLYYQYGKIKLAGTPDEVYEVYLSLKEEIIVLNKRPHLGEAADHEMITHFLCIEEEFGQSPAYGIIEEENTGRYHIVKNTSKERGKFLMT